MPSASTLVIPDVAARIETGKTPEGITYVHISAGNPGAALMLFDAVRQRLAMQTVEEKKIMAGVDWLMTHDPNKVNAALAKRGINAKMRHLG